LKGLGKFFRKKDNIPKKLKKERPMYFFHSPAMWEQFPELVPGVLVAGGIRSCLDQKPDLDPFFQQARSRLGEGPESGMPEVAAWRQAFSKMGFKPTKYRSAAEALLRRFRKEDTLPALHPLVDLCNAVSLAFALPVAVFDVDRLDSGLEVCHASGDEQHMAFSGEMEGVGSGEVIFRDRAGHAHARRWTFRQSRQSVVDPETDRALVVSEGLHETASKDVEALIQTLAQGIKGLGMTVHASALLTAVEPRLEFQVP
jgi:DNA/RNA-binding domain of Phe-tRNA-synthetase-like protein